MPLEKVLFALDVANEGISLAVLTQEGEPLASFNEHPTRQQAEFLASHTQNLLKEAGLTPHDLSAVVATTGPGGFSGVRVGVAFGRAFASALRIPFKGYTTLQAIAFHVVSQHSFPICVMLSGGRGQFYCQGFSANAVPLTGQLCLTKEDLSPLKEFFQTQTNVIIAGSGSEALTPFLGNMIEGDTPALVLSEARVSALSLGRLSLLNENDQHPDALYLRGADAALPVVKRSWSRPACL
jgi:tRNA threonylcarbamoyladenosine biosynthesis protein TsaB